MLKDEHQALQLAFTALEEKYRKCQEDNRDLVERWMQQKSKDADKLNEENDKILRYIVYFSKVHLRYLFTFQFFSFKFPGLQLSS